MSAPNFGPFREDSRDASTITKLTCKRQMNHGEVTLMVEAT